MHPSPLLTARKRPSIGVRYKVGLAVKGLVSGVGFGGPAGVVSAILVAVVACTTCSLMCGKCVADCWQMCGRLCLGFDSLLGDVWDMIGIRVK